ncbi:MAG TPA: winged helix-turn-helix domain-containing protein [Polyangiaceae bacterium]
MGDHLWCERSTLEKRSVLLIASNDPEERDCLCKWAVSAGLSARVSPTLAFSRVTAIERDVIIRIGLYSPEARRCLGTWPDGTATIFICDDPWDRTCRLLAPDANVDCLCRPFAISELLWRAERALCRVRQSSGEREAKCFRFGTLRYDVNLCEVRVGTQPVALRRAERGILVYLLRNSHRFVTAAELQTEVLGSQGNGGAVRNQIYELRRRLARAGVLGTIICEPRKGYRLLESDAANLISMERSPI